ncbi:MULTISPECIES: universal stress protein [Actinomycetes]|uniref:universal stress protein n=1 Tax=Actinomycetes TaxID=1760 RepID=UPI0005EC9A13|nr:universal stress protein [Saccharothrix sp. ST-888]KJK55807.1 universal stress protein UspA [Saccharothrix sp. ST-888]
MFERGTDGPKVIVVGVDGSDSSWRAAAYAAGLARRQGSKLALVYVQPVSAMLAMTGFGGELGGTTESVAEEIVQQAREAAERLGSTFSVHWEFHTLVGDPFTGLADTADGLRADAVVVGASEQAGHRVMGSLAVRLVKAARWPVTVVP